MSESPQLKVTDDEAISYHKKELLRLLGAEAFILQVVRKREQYTRSVMASHNTNTTDLIPNSPYRIDSMLLEGDRGNKPLSHYLLEVRHSFRRLIEFGFISPCCGGIHGRLGVMIEARRRLAEQKCEDSGDPHDVIVSDAEILHAEDELLQQTIFGLPVGGKN